MGEIEQRLVQFGEVTYFGRPVIHLYIDVQVVVAVPWGLHRVCPEPLQIERQRMLVCTADHQVTAVLEVECGESRIVVHLKIVQTFVGSKTVILLAQVEFYPVELFLILLCMIGF
ncbi:hypothetical protein SDC9_205572 [bioreactor metagenome]|uniref:Uncharacterized protein n=1 Tax=bioreactor metagenome TaxID=1076179 RepID=A0A645J357_9ZZZZ